jgi:hypothetical protein
LDEWYISDSKYTYSVTHYYDQGYICRFATEDTTAFESIKHYQDTVSEILFDLFALKVEASYYTRAASAADTCKTLPLEFESLDDFCNHPDDHLSRYSNVAGIENGAPTTTKIVWTGHILYHVKTDEDGDHIIISSSGSYASLYKIIITPSQSVIWCDANGNDLVDEGDYCENKPQNVIEYQSVFSLLHEISHQLGAVDHYCQKPAGALSCGDENCFDCNDDLVEKKKCLMYKRFDITQEENNEEIYCEHCIERITSHLNDHHEIGG